VALVESFYADGTMLAPSAAFATSRYLTMPTSQPATKSSVRFAASMHNIAVAITKFRELWLLDQQPVRQGRSPETFSLHIQMCSHVRSHDAFYVLITYVLLSVFADLRVQ